MVPHTSDGRVLFAVPWNNYVVVGTTDTLIKYPKEEPEALEKEIEFILENAGAYMTKQPTRADIKVFSLDYALWPPLKMKGVPQKKFNHKVTVSTSGLVSILDGKWTTPQNV